MIINLHDGHNPDGEVGLIKESTEARSEGITEKSSTSMDLAYKVELKGTYHIVDAEILINKLEQSGFDAELLSS